jgi:hypothetical protein
LHSQGVSAQLVRQGHSDLYATFIGNRAGGGDNVQTDVFASHDGGSTWKSHDDPCAAPSGDEIDTVSIAAAPGAAFAALCETRIQEQPAVSIVVSTDGAATFGPRRQVVGTNIGTIAMASPADIVVATSDMSGGGPIDYEVDVSHDGGRTWKTAVTDPQDLTGLIVNRAFLGFESTKVGRWVGYPRSIWTTTDGGDHWSAHRFA